MLFSYLFQDLLLNTYTYILKFTYIHTYIHSDLLETHVWISSEAVAMIQKSALTSMRHDARSLKLIWCGLETRCTSKNDSWRPPNCNSNCSGRGWRKRETHTHPHFPSLPRGGRSLQAQCVRPLLHEPRDWPAEPVEVSETYASNAVVSHSKTSPHILSG